MSLMALGGWVKSDQCVTFTPQSPDLVPPLPALRGVCAFYGHIGAALVCQGELLR